jgi:hypothetical protein
MEISLGEIKIKLIYSGNQGQTIMSTLNCMFTNGFKNGKGSLGAKNFYFYLEEGEGGRGLMFKSGMDWAPKEIKDYMEFLKEMYSELVKKQGELITTKEFLGYLVYKRRSEIIDNI